MSRLFVQQERQQRGCTRPLRPFFSFQDLSRHAADGRDTNTAGHDTVTLPNGLIILATIVTIVSHLVSLASFMLRALRSSPFAGLVCIMARNYLSGVCRAARAWTRKDDDSLRPIRFVRFPCVTALTSTEISLPRWFLFFGWGRGRQFLEDPCLWSPFYNS